MPIGFPSRFLQATDVLYRRQDGCIQTKWQSPWRLQRAALIRRHSRAADGRGAGSRASRGIGAAGQLDQSRRRRLEPWEQLEHRRSTGALSAGPNLAGCDYALPHHRHERRRPEKLPDARKRHDSWRRSYPVGGMGGTSWLTLINFNCEDGLEPSASGGLVSTISGQPLSFNGNINLSSAHITVGDDDLNFSGAVTSPNSNLAQGDFLYLGAQLEIYLETNQILTTAMLRRRPVT